MNPSNSMFDDQGKAVIIDFNTFTRIGESLENVASTYEWYDEELKAAHPQNDLNAFDEIRIWLGG
ncbi:hypothetical protein QBC38DRAFT_488018 [Podospora fimiseda]|uniref:Protein kinase domain-containing protein n=1 Tax=Podospora fimiseda TaxID=252190 RepID=A0AAN7BHE5_9PEZI|nr:hypothetical protein QBC38DRAFT_488018 [Podospora fimiseda]